MENEPVRKDTVVPSIPSAVFTSGRGVVLRSEQTHETPDGFATRRSEKTQWEATMKKP